MKKCGNKFENLMAVWNENPFQNVKKKLSTTGKCTLNREEITAISVISEPPATDLRDLSSIAESH